MDDVMSIREHAVVVARAQQQLRYLERHPGSSRRQLGTGRNLVNRIANTQPHPGHLRLLRELLLQDLVGGVYDHQPHDPGRQ